MRNWKSLKKELITDNEVAKAYGKLKPRYDLISKIIEARKKKGLTQAELAKKVGTKQSAIARVESGISNPTVYFLEKLANALDIKLIIQFK